jgi:hypothetical protein
MSLGRILGIGGNSQAGADATSATSSGRGGSVSGGPSFGRGRYHIRSFGRGRGETGLAAFPGGSPGNNISSPFGGAAPMGRGGFTQDAGRGGGDRGGRGHGHGRGVHYGHH